VQQQYAIQQQQQYVLYASFQQYGVQQPQQQQPAEAPYAAPHQRQYAQCVGPQYMMREVQ